MKILTVPNWSFGRNRALFNQFKTVLESSRVSLHFLQSDPDHNRTVSAFSGEPADVLDALYRLCEAALDSIDLNGHVGVHPRIGALDVCPFVASKANEPAALRAAEEFGAGLAARFDLPVFLYEKSERGRHEADLPSLRKGGFGSMLGKELHPDFGPAQAHPRLGVAVVGVRDFLIAANVDLRDPDPAFAMKLARLIRIRRTEGDPRFLGVRALGFPLASREASQVSLNVTLPDLTPLDPIVEWIADQAHASETVVTGTELIGVIRPQDLAAATRFKIEADQIVDLDQP